MDIEVLFSILFILFLIVMAFGSGSKSSSSKDHFKEGVAEISNEIGSKMTSIGDNLKESSLKKQIQGTLTNKNVFLLYQKLYSILKIYPYLDQEESIKYTNEDNDKKILNEIMSNKGFLNKCNALKIENIFLYKTSEKKISSVKNIIEKEKNGTLEKALIFRVEIHRIFKK